MGEHSELKQLVIGLPKTGKTTFLAALWHVVESSEVAGSLKLVELQGERQHLNSIRTAWLGCRAVERTLVDSEKLVAMKLGSSSDSRTTELVLPDLSGESFRLQWESREWTNTYVDFAAASSGMLLFVHPMEISNPIPISEATDRIIHAIDPIEGQSPDQGVSDDLEPWTPDKAPTQVKLVELLQFLRAGPYASRILRVAVVISAWDLVIAEGKSPEMWLAKHLPLLEQFMRANHENIQCRIYGLSAQGGDLTSSTKLLARSPASERIIIIGKDCASHDITAPIKWLMD